MPPSSKSPAVVVLWDLGTRRAMGTLPGHKARISALAFSPDGKTLASGGEDQSVRFWDVAERREAGRIENNPGWVRSVVFTSDGKSLVIGSGLTLKVWDVASNRVRAILEPDGHWVRSIALAPNGRMLASAGGTLGPEGRVRQAQVRLYDISQDPPIRRTTLIVEGNGPDQANPHAGGFSAVAFSADGRRVVAVAMATVAIWDAETGILIDDFDRSSASSSESLATSPDGRWLAITEAKTPRIIDITPPFAP